MAKKHNPLVGNPISIRIIALFAITAMMVITSSFPVIANKWDGNGSTELLAGLLPNNSPHKFAIDLPVDQYVTYLPLIQNVYLPNNSVQNGGFEEGHLAWVEYSKLGYYLIFDETLSP
ncbi:hypothetical protein EG834_04145, partial [bacterium]|nr:hypothetical protein [bacterium]